MTHRPHHFVTRNGLLVPESLGVSDEPFTAESVGVSPRTLGDLVERGFLRRVCRGVFVSADAADTLAARARALSLVLPKDAVVTDRTAAWLYGVDVLLPGEHLLVPPVCAVRRAEGYRLRRPGVTGGERQLTDRDVHLWHGLSVTTPLRTACDLGRNRSRDRAFAGLEAMIRAGVDKEAVLAELGRFKGYRWVINLRTFAPLMDPRAESIAESVTRLRWYDTTPPYPEVQIPVPNPYGDDWRLDLGVGKLWMAVEYDGEEFHDDPEAQWHDAERRKWIAENTPWVIHVVRKKNVMGRHQDFDRLLKRWLIEARRTLPMRLQRLQGGRWYTDVGQ